MVNAVASASTSESSPSRRHFSIATYIVFWMLLVYWGALFYGTHTKVPEGLLPGNSDKFIHFWAYAGLGILLMSFRSTFGVYPWISVFLCWVLLALYGVFDELTQLLVNRNADLNDWLCDLAGASTGLAIVTFVVWIFRTRLRSHFQKP